MSETFDKLLENRDYWRDEAKASWADIEALEVGNSRPFCRPELDKFCRV